MKNNSFNSILLSAYACEPHKGSEPSVGWKYVIDASREFSIVHVVTRRNNKELIDLYLNNNKLDNVTFHYHDLNKFFLFLKRKFNLTHIYAYLWEISLFFFLIRMFKKNYFDVSRKVTFVSYKFPSFLWFFSKNFILGPIGGGESFPINFLKYFPMKVKVQETIRLLMNYFFLFDPLVVLTFYKADQIQIANSSTYKFLPYFKKKFFIQPAISVNPIDFNIVNSTINKNNKIIQFLYVGRLIHWKGLLFALMALRSISSSKYHLKIIGNGSDEVFFNNYVKRFNLNAQFIPNVPRRNLSSYYSACDYFIFFSLHDSGGMVVKEAKYHGAKVIISDFGGLKHINIDKNDIVIRSKNIDDFILKITKTFKELIFLQK